VGDTADKSLPVGGIRHRLRRRKQLEQDLEHITQEMYRRNRELAGINSTLSLLQTINTFALEPQTSLNTICHQITQAISDATGYPFVAIFTRPDDNFGGLQLRGWQSNDRKLLALLSGISSKGVNRVHLDDSYVADKNRSMTLSAELVKSRDIEQLFNCSAATAHLIKKQTVVKSLYIVKLIARNHLVGILVAGFVNNADGMLPQDTLLLDRLSEPVGVALDNRLLYEENRRVLRQLTRSNAKLKALDETKDEFITMASHQLRTPLTSVKGYLSMVLEGDAGKLNANQQKLLQQSFISSQRMVYLISDLLNLSRLNTGKFVIESTPVDLAEVVQSEIDQLAETAKSRELTLVYEKPAAFPLLLLDETKIHQVVMNFIDNAIYYTPAGGTVTVELRETPTAIEYMVHDTGIGVPKAVQHKLFTKFYRAQNAQQARPDGTGLGLFMARKIIVAQGGSVIFQSEEGKGSTFGFRFGKARHAVPASSARSAS